MRLRPAALAAAAGVVALAAALTSHPTDAIQSPAPASAAPQPGRVATAEDVRVQCGLACHPTPPPDVLPRAAWRDEIVKMMLIRDGEPEPSGGLGFVPLSRDLVPTLRYYEANAPERLPEAEPWPDPDGALALTRRPIAAMMPQVAIAIANARFVDLDGDTRLDVIASDMRSGPLLAAFAAKNFALESIASVGHPAHIEPVDLDKDGLLDLLVPDLGSFQPADHADGRLIWLRRQKTGGYQPIVLARGFGRAADARAADFDGDGDLDIVLAVFGWRKTGGILLLENQTKDWSKPTFTAKTIDTRTGSIHVPVADLNGDGRPDFVALFAQQHESIVAFLGAGAPLTFEARTIYAAPHPNWGSSGIEIVDLDQDGDLDVLATHGDTFDDFVVKPYHGIQWFENTGSYPFVEHTLAKLPGAQRAQAADMDGDGDLDIVAAAMIADGEANERLASIVWLEQTRPRVFVRHTIEKGTPNHATLDLADYNGDGRPDILIGWFAFNKPFDAWLDLWTSGKRP